MQSDTGATFWNQWWRVGGLLGIGWIVLFIIGGFILQGETPSRDDDIAEIREYFTDDAEMYLAGDYLIGLGFTLFFLPFLVILRRVLGVAAGWPNIFARVALLAGVIALIWGGIAGFFWGTLAVGAAEHEEIDDSAVRLLMEIDVYAFAGLQLPVGVFMLATGLSIWLGRTLSWRWIGIVAIIGGILALIGAAWPIDGDEEGALAIPGFIGFLLILISVLLISINLLLTKIEPVEIGPNKTVV